MGTQADKAVSPTKGQRLRLVLLATTDLHANLRPYNYYLDSEGDDPGLARIATLVDRQRAQNSNCLLFDNGDTLQGSPLGDLASEPSATGPHPMIAAMNLMGYDAATVGNHDFNYGLPFLHRVIAGARFPVVVANVDRADGTPLLPRSVILERDLHDATGKAQRLRIGVLGVTPPQIIKWDMALLSGQITTRPIVDAARSEAAKLRAAGVDLIVALCHSGQGSAENTLDLENALLPLAAAGVADAIIAGHSHRQLPTGDDSGLIHGTPVVQPGFFGSHLGQITLDLAFDGGWKVAEATACLHPVLTSDGPVPASPAILRLSEDSHSATLAHARRRIGKTETPLETYFALADNSPTLAVMAEATMIFARNLLRGDPAEALPLLSAVAPFKGGGRAGPGYYTDIPAGPLSLRNAADLYAFPNTLQILRATGADLTDWLERAASAFHQITPGLDGQALLDPGFSSYNFDVIFGLSYTIDLSQLALYSADGEHFYPGPGRIRDLRFAGQPVQAIDQALIVTNSYRASGGGHFTAPTRCKKQQQSPVAVRKLLADHIAQASPLRPRSQETWRFAPLNGTRVIYETGPGALTHRDRIAALNLRPLDQTSDGFQRFEMVL